MKEISPVGRCTTGKTMTEGEMVNHPLHYNTHPSGVECIDVIQHMSFNVGTAVKYLWRHTEKGNPLEDLEKALFYVKQEIELRKVTAGTPSEPEHYE